MGLSVQIKVITIFLKIEPLTQSLCPACMTDASVLEKIWSAKKYFGLGLWRKHVSHSVSMLTYWETVLNSTKFCLWKLVHKSVD